MKAEARDRSEHEPTGSQQAFVDAAIGLVERDNRFGGQQIRYLDREQGVLVSISVNTDNFAHAPKIPGGEWLRKKRVRKKNLSAGVSVMVVDTTRVHDAEASDHGVLKGTVLEFGGDDSNQKDLKVNSYRINRDLSGFPNYSHGHLPFPDKNFTDKELEKYKEVLNSLDRGDMVSDWLGFRTISEVRGDNVLAADFLEWAENSYESTQITIGSEEGFDEITNHGSIATINEWNEMTMITFIPSHDNFCVVVKQEEFIGGWVVTEYMVDRRESLKRIYKHQSTHFITKEQVGPVDMVTKPPFSSTGIPAPFRAQQEYTGNNQKMSDIIYRKNRVERAELEDLMYLSEEIGSDYQDDSASSV